MEALARTEKRRERRRESRYKKERRERRERRKKGKGEKGWKETFTSSGEYRAMNKKERNGRGYKRRKKIKMEGE